MFDRFAEVVQPFVEMVFFMNAAAHQTGAEGTNQPVSFRKFDDPVTQQSCLEGQNTRPPSSQRQRLPQRNIFA